MTTGTGLLSAAELEAIRSFLTEAGVEARSTLTATPISTGRSNITAKLSDGVSSWVLRMPPRAGRTPSAHDVVREFRVTSALAGTGVPVPPAVAACTDEAVIGAPFAIADFVSGAAVQTRNELDALDDETLGSVLQELVSTLATLHGVDHVEIGLERFGRPDAYAERQLNRWAAQWDIVGGTDHPKNALARAIVEKLGAQIPEQPSTSVVHGDFRLDNALLKLESTMVSVAAVVDWELSTIGDPVADVAMMCAYRNEAFDLIVGQESAWTSSRLPSADGLAAMYEKAGGVALQNFDYHLALANFKVAVIAAGIDHRYRAGAASGAGFATAADSVEPYLESSISNLR